MAPGVAESQIQQKQLSVCCACVSLSPLSPSYRSTSSQNARLGSSHYTATSHQLLGFLVAQTVKNLSATQETRVRSLGQENPLEKEMATHSRILAWRIPRQRSLAGYSPWGHKESDTTKTHTLPLAIYLTHDNVYMSKLPSPFFPPSPSSAMSTSPFSTSMSPSFPCKQVHQYYFPKFHIYIYIY